MNYYSQLPARVSRVVQEWHDAFGVTTGPGAALTLVSPTHVVRNLLVRGAPTA